jgi:hypothetical protein
MHAAVRRYEGVDQSRTHELTKKVDETRPGQGTLHRPTEGNYRMSDSAPPPLTAKPAR